MQVQCANCHTAFDLEEGGEHTACPNCGAEAGLEPVKGIPPAMRTFGVVLGLVVASVIVGDLVSRIVG